MYISEPTTSVERFKLNIPTLSKNQWRSLGVSWVGVSSPTPLSKGRPNLKLKYNFLNSKFISKLFIKMDAWNRKPTWGPNPE